MGTSRHSGEDYQPQNKLSEGQGILTVSTPTLLAPDSPQALQDSEQGVWDNPVSWPPPDLSPWSLRVCIPHPPQLTLP